MLQRRVLQMQFKAVSKRSTRSVNHSGCARHCQPCIAEVINDVRKLRDVTLHSAHSMNSIRLAKQQLNPMQIVHMQIN